MKLTIYSVIRILKKTGLLFLFLILGLSIVAQAQTPPDPPTVVTAVTPCNAGTFTLTGVTPGPNQDIRWYDNFYKQTLLATGNTFTGNVTQSTVYYAATFDNTTGLESPFPATVYVFKPQNPFVTINVTNVSTSTRCVNNLTVVPVKSRDSIDFVPTDDAFVQANLAANNHGALVNLVIRGSMYHSSNAAQIYQKYDLRPIPNDVSIASSYLRLTRRTGFAHGNDGNIYAHLSTDSWTEGAITWNNKPAVTNPGEYVFWIWDDDYAFDGYGPTTYIDRNVATFWSGLPGVTGFVNDKYNTTKILSVMLESIGYDNCFRSKEYTTNIQEIPLMRVHYEYNDVLTYQWTGPAGFTSTQPNLTNVSQGGTYTLTVTNPFGCTYTTSVTIPGNTVSSINGAICSNEVYTIAGHNFNTPGLHTVNLTSSEGCDSVVLLNLQVYQVPDKPQIAPNIAVCQYDRPVVLNPVAGNAQWYDAARNPITIAPSYTTDVVNSYKWYITDSYMGCVSDTAEVNVHILPKPVISAAPDTVMLCINNSATLTVSGTDSYEWTPAAGLNTTTGHLVIANPTVSTTYRVVGQNEFGCTDTAFSRVNVIPEINTYDTISICRGDTLFFAGNKYYDAGTYDITFTSQNNCDSFVHLNIKVIEIPNADFDLPDFICKNEKVNVQASWTAPGLRYHWDLAGATVYDGRESQYIVFWETPGERIISLQVYDAHCPSKRFYDTVTIRDLPVAHITHTAPTKVCAGDTLRAYAEFYPNYYYQWEPARLFKPNTQNAQNTLYAEQNVPIYVTVTDNYGCSNTSGEYKIDVYPCCEVGVPNAFTPNNDGKNDHFRYVQNGNIELINFRIVNRWGQVVFETTDEKRGWDGTFNSKAQDAGTYFYYLRYRCDSRLVEKQGDLSLIR